MATYGPRVTLDVPSGEDYAKSLRVAAGFGEHGGGTRSFHRDNEPSGEVRSSVRSVFRAAMGEVPDDFELESVAVRDARVEVTVSVPDDVDDDESAGGVGGRLV